MLCLSLLLGFGFVTTPAQAPWCLGLPELYRLDLLPAFKRSIKIGNVSSYDRTGGNDDGFSGKYSFVRKEGDDLVLADLKGPGCIYRIHTPTPTDDPLEFYFDGEASPRIATTFRKLFSGGTAPFVKPLVDAAGGGYYCYVPLPYKKSCKILLRAKTFQFYDLNYATYPDDAPIRTYQPVPTAEDVDAIRMIQAAWGGGKSGDLSSFNVPSGAKVHRQAFSGQLAAGKSLTLFDTRHPGRIASLRLEPAEALAGKGRDILIRISWDGEKPAVLCPAGDFFGYAWGKPASGSCLVGTNAGTDYCNLPMPFDHAAKVELVSLRSGGPALSVRGEVVFADAPRRPYEGKFYAVWRRENPTTNGKPFTYFESRGRGHVVGLALQAQGKESGSTEFFEGDDETTIDGDMVIHGTGSEDSFNGGWYDVPDRWDGPVARPLSGCMLYQKPLGRTGGYRFMIGDAYSYRSGILQTIEHGPEKNLYPADYCAVTYLYSESRPTDRIEMPTPGELAVQDPPRIVFSPDWTVPISSFSFADATLSRTSVPVGKGRQRCLSFRAKGEDWFGPPFVSLVCSLPAGKYRLLVNAVKGPEQGVVQLFRDEVPIGPPVDLYTANGTLERDIFLGEVSAVEGDNRIMFKLVGKNGASNSFGLDLVNLIFVRVP